MFVLELAFLSLCCAAWLVACGSCVCGVWCAAWLVARAVLCLCVVSCILWLLARCYVCALLGGTLLCVRIDWWHAVMCAHWLVARCYVCALTGGTESPGITLPLGRSLMPSGLSAQWRVLKSGRSLVRKASGHPGISLPAWWVDWLPYVVGFEVKEVNQVQGVGSFRDQSSCPIGWLPYVVGFGARDITRARRCSLNVHSASLFLRGSVFRIHTLSWRDTTLMSLGNSQACFLTHWPPNPQAPLASHEPTRFTICWCCSTLFHAFWYLEELSF